MKIKEMRAMEAAEAKKQLHETRAELAKEKAIAAGGTRPENPGKIRGLRKTIARLITIINEKEKAKEGKEKKKTKRQTKKTKERKTKQAKTRKTKAREKKPKKKPRKEKRNSKKEVKKE